MKVRVSHLLSGIALEVSTYPHATCLAADCRLCDDRLARNLSLAANAYRRGERTRSTLSPTRTCGWDACCISLGDRHGARQELAEAERITNRVELLYLVALFRADLNQQAGDLQGCAAEAERAVSLGPEFQSARIALAHLSDQLGTADRSRQIVDEPHPASARSAIPGGSSNSRPRISIRSRPCEPFHPPNDAADGFWPPALVLATPFAVDGQTPVFRARVDLVRLDVSVRRSDRPVVGLRADDFVLTDNGRPQRIESAALESMPLSVLLVLDTSGSMAGPRFANLIAGAKDVLKNLRPGDHAALLTFSSHIRRPSS